MAGPWRIVKTSGWDRDAIDLVEPGFIEFGAARTEQFGFIAVHGWLDSRPIHRDGRPGVEFSWEGNDEGDLVSGRGWAVLVDDETIEGPDGTASARNSHTGFSWETARVVDGYPVALWREAFRRLRQG
jgi:hypothetical protein